MIELRKSEQRGVANIGWLHSRHSFSFGEYYDPQHVGFGPLLVINEDQVQPGRGFGTHGHRNMEIISYVLSGELTHKDSMGNGSVIRPGDVQRMSAGTGVTHSEFNPSQTEPVHFLQIWIEPSRHGVTPSYEQLHIDGAAKRGVLRIIASPDGRDGSVRLHQEALIYASMLSEGDRIEFTLQPDRRAYVHVARGAVSVNGMRLANGDALKISQESQLILDQAEDAELLLFDLP
jgi:redox-sensitive bicupin YhaK (pirin superfamily)